MRRTIVVNRYDGKKIIIDNPNDIEVIFERNRPMKPYVVKLKVDEKHFKGIVRKLGGR